MDRDSARAPVHGAPVCFWAKRRLLPAPVPLTGAGALEAKALQGRAGWTIACPDALAGKAADHLELEP